ncbi:MAG: HAD hydrolase family protein [Phycisphaerales bacterium]
MPPRGYDLLALDLDGTLLNERGKISAANLRAIADARRAGLQIVVSTGRGYAEAMHSLPVDCLDGAIICAGGAMTVDMISGRTLHRSTMPESLVERVAQTLNEATGHLVLLLKDHDTTGLDYLLVGRGRIDPASEWWFNQIPVRLSTVERPAEDPHPRETVRVAVVTTVREMSTLWRVMNERFQNETFVHHFPIISGAADGRVEKSGEIHLLEVFQPETNKWSALAELAAEREIPVERVAAIGDEVNDLAMLRGAGLGIAMGNAPDSVQDAAQQVTETNVNDGVALAIERILEGSW